MTSVAVVGSANLDLVVEVPHLPNAGETVLGADLVTRPGGKGANQAVAAARLGTRTALFVAIGHDPSGATLRAALAATGLDLAAVTTVPGVPTGTALVIVSADGENMITVSPGANARLRPPELAALTAPDAGYTVVLLQLEIPYPTCLAAVELARRTGALVMLNAAPLPASPDPVLTELIRSVDVLVVNEGEARQLAAAAGPPADPAGWAELARGLRDSGPRLVVVTLGERGVVAVDDRDTYLQPAFPVRAVDTTGAGDAFCGALAEGLAHHRPLPDALRRAAAVGALATTEVGAQAGLPTAAELAHLLPGQRPAAG